MKFETPYNQLGGADTIESLVEVFYLKVFNHPDLKPLFQGEINEIMRKQRMFLTQFLGGPTLYSNEFGPPGMQHRHMPFEITPKRAKAWLGCMHEAMDDIELEGPVREDFFNRLTHVASIMVNTPDAEGEI